MLALQLTDIVPAMLNFCMQEKIATYADQLLVYCMKSYRMPKDPKDLVLQVQIALVRTPNDVLLLISLYRVCISSSHVYMVNCGFSLHQMISVALLQLK